MSNAWSVWRQTCGYFPIHCHTIVYQATGYASQHIWCLSQARINWEGCARKGILHKNGGYGRGGGHQLVWMGWQSIQIVGASVSVIFILLQKIQKMVKCTFWYRLTRVVLDKVHRAIKWLCMCVCAIQLMPDYTGSWHRHTCAWTTWPRSLTSNETAGSRTWVTVRCLNQYTITPCHCALIAAYYYYTRDAVIGWWLYCSTSSTQWTTSSTVQIPLQSDIQPFSAYSVQVGSVTFTHIVFDVAENEYFIKRACGSLWLTTVVYCVKKRLQLAKSAKKSKLC